MNVGSQKCIINSIDSQTSLKCTIPAGTGDVIVPQNLHKLKKSGANIPTSIVVDGQTGTAATTFSYSAPTLNIDALPSTEGGNITFTGTNFGSVVSRITAVGCTNVRLITAHTKVGCVIQSGTGAAPQVLFFLNSFVFVK